MNRVDAALAEGRPVHWTDLADCAERTNPTFDLAGVPVNERNAVARWYCMGCPVVKECAVDALKYRDTGVVRAGVWLQSAGNQTPAARRRLQKVVQE